MRRLIIAGVAITVAATLTAKRLGALKELEKQFVKWLVFVAPRSTDGTITEVLAKYDFSKILNGTEFRQATPDVFARRLLVDAYAEVHRQEQDADSGGYTVLTDAQKDFLVLGLSGMAAAARSRRRQRRSAIQPS